MADVDTRLTGVVRHAPPGGWARAGMVVGAAALSYVVLPSVIHVLVWRTRWKPGIDALRWYHKRVDKRRALRTAGGRGQSAAAVHHSGRRSGRPYVTPVWAHRVGDSFYIGLPYGTHTDWLRNVRSAGGCDLDHDGVRYRTVEPVLVSSRDLPRALARKRRLFDLMGIDSFLRVDIAPAQRTVDADGTVPQLARAG
jgi:deazaflavin-dependent oxidoreductase (nitroreductase family)